MRNFEIAEAPNPWEIWNGRQREREGVRFIEPKSSTLHQRGPKLCWRFSQRCFRFLPPVSSSFSSLHFQVILRQIAYLFQLFYRLLLLMVLCCREAAKLLKTEGTDRSEDLRKVGVRTLLCKCVLIALLTPSQILCGTIGNFKSHPSFSLTGISFILSC